MSTKKTDDTPVGEVVRYKDKDGAIHWASRNSPKVVKALEAGEITIVEEVPADAPKVSKPSDAPNAVVVK